MNKLLLEFQEHLKTSKRIVALVGAGLSVGSGLPTFRGSQGLWKNFNMIDLATPDAFYIDPGLVWQFYSWRRYNALKSHPNKGHKALAQLAKVPGLEFMTITQNVDGLLVRAGTPKDKLYEIHGSLFDLKCTSFTCNYKDHDNFTHPLTESLRDTEEEFDNCRKRRRDEAPGPSQVLGETSGEVSPESPQFKPVKQIDEENLPRCPSCHALLRPGVVWFGESLSLNLLNQIDDFVEQGVDLILVVGTSGTVYPANSYVDRVKYKGGKVAIFNTDIEGGILEGEEENVWGFRGDAGEMLEMALAKVIEGTKGATGL